MDEAKGTIVYIGGFEMPDKNAAANRVLNNAKAFAALGYNVVFCGVDHNISENQKQPVRFSCFESWPSKYPSSTSEWIKEQMSFKHIEYVLSQYTDIKYVIGYNMHALPLKNLERWSKKRQIKVLIDATEWYPNTFSIRPGKFVRWLDTNLVMRVFQKKADGVIAISSLLSNYYQGCIEKTVIVPPLVDISEDKWHQESVTQSGCVEFTYSGIAGNGKGVVKDKIDIVIKAMARIDSNMKYHFSVFGMTKDECSIMFPGIDDAIQKLGEKINFYGKVSHSDSIKSLYESDYCIFLRNKNRQNMAGFPTKFAECVTSGIGVVVNDISDINKYFPLKNSILLDDINEQVVAEAIENCVRNGKVRHTISDTFDYHNYVSLFEEYLEK